MENKNKKKCKVDNVKPRIRYNNENNILLRKKELFEKLDNEKLNYIKNGICDSYIKFGKPSLDTVINSIHEKNNIKSKRLQKLINLLKEEGEEYDENNSYYKNYIKNGGDIRYAINEGIKEWFFMNKTHYLKFLKKYKNEEIAELKALNKYINDFGTDKYTEYIRKSEMNIKLYI